MYIFILFGCTLVTSTTRREHTCMWLGYKCMHETYHAARTGFSQLRLHVSKMTPHAFSVNSCCCIEISQKLALQTFLNCQVSWRSSFLTCCSAWCTPPHRLLVWNAEKRRKGWRELERLLKTCISWYDVYMRISRMFVYIYPAQLFSGIRCVCWQFCVELWQPRAHTHTKTLMHTRTLTLTHTYTQTHSNTHFFTHSHSYT